MLNARRLFRSVSTFGRQLSLPERKYGMFRKIVSLLAALVLAAGTAGTAAAEGDRKELRFTVAGAETLWAEGTDGGTAAEAARKKGLANPVTAEDLSAAGARIDREDGIVFMIRDFGVPRMARTAEEAAETAWSLVKTLGGDEGAELELVNRMDIGETGVWFFHEVRGGEPVYGRMLKIIRNAEGRVDTVVSSLGFPEETDESLGVQEDPLGQKVLEAEAPEIPDFSKMIRGEWSCQAEIRPGESAEITVPVMQDPDTGLWYLADPGRKIALGDFRKMVLEGQADCLLSSPQCGGWDPADALVFYRIIQCRDFFARKGWEGPDGLGTPVLLLNNLCLLTGESMENACYLGMLQEKWQAFAYSGEAGFGKCLDVLAHEYTHAVTETSVGAGLYKDDYGAINEAISDIVGNLCEMMLGETKDTGWNVGENLGSAFRSMGDPHAHHQPEYVWDEFYAPKALYPNDVNDRGGVHVNSSILNYTASRLCLDAGMTPEEALDFWWTVALAMGSRTDYCQMAELLDWALRETGLEKYSGALRALVGKTRMTLRERPDAVPDGQMLVELDLPDTEAMKDHGWLLAGIQLQPGEALASLLDLLAAAPDGEGSLLGLLEQADGEEPAAAGAWGSSGLTAFQERIGRIFLLHSTWRAAEGEPLAMIVRRGLPTLYVLMNIDLNTTDLRGMAILAGSEWTDLGSFAAGPGEGNEPDGETAGKIAESLLSLGMSLLFPESAERQALPAAGLDRIELTAVPEAEAPAA